MIKKYQNAGFTLIEILVALLLMTMVLMFSLGGTFSHRQDLDKALNNIERSIRFSVDEAALRNVISRVRFYLDEEPQTLTIELGPDDHFVIPLSAREFVEATNEREKKEREEKAKKINSNFTTIDDIDKNNLTMPENVKIIGIGTTLMKKMVTEFENSIYIYPTGEKDASFLALATEDEMAILKVSAFEPNIKREYQSLENINPDNFDEEVVNLANEAFLEWIKE